MDFDASPPNLTSLIQGRVVDMLGKPCSGVTVYLISPKEVINEEDAARFFWLADNTPRRELLTTPKAEFKFGHCASGQHIIYAESATKRSKPGLMTVQGRDLNVLLTLKIDIGGTSDDIKTKTPSQQAELVSKWASEIKDVTTSNKVPMSTAGVVSEIDPGLWLGDARAARDLKNLAEVGVTAVLNCASGTYTRTSAATYGESTKYLELADSKVGDETISPPQLQLALDFVTASLEEGRKVLVHCISGTNKSAMVCCAHVMLTKQLQVLKATYHVSKAAPGYILSAPKSRAQLAELALAKGLAEPKRKPVPTLKKSQPLHLAEPLAAGPSSASVPAASATKKPMTEVKEPRAEPEVQPTAEESEGKKLPPRSELEVQQPRARPPVQQEPIAPKEVVPDEPAPKEAPPKEQPLTKEEEEEKVELERRLVEALARLNIHAGPFEEDEERKSDTAGAKRATTVIPKLNLRSGPAASSNKASATTSRMHGNEQAGKSSQTARPASRQKSPPLIASRPTSEKFETARSGSSPAQCGSSTARRRLAEPVLGLQATPRTRLAASSEEALERLRAGSLTARHHGAATARPSVGQRGEPSRAGAFTYTPRAGAGGFQSAQAKHAQYGRSRTRHR